MSLVNNEKTLRPVKGDIWVTRHKTFSLNEVSQPISVCIKMGNGAFAAIEYLRLERTGEVFKKEEKIGLIDSPEFENYVTSLATSSVPGKSSETFQSEEELFRRIEEVYKENGSMKRTARFLGVSEERVCRVLITIGEYTCEAHQKITALLKEGKSFDDIAHEVGIQRNRLRRYLPYK